VSSVPASGTWHEEDVSEALRSRLNVFINARISLRVEVSPSLCCKGTGELRCDALLDLTSENDESRTACRLDFVGYSLSERSYDRLLR